MNHDDMDDTIDERDLVMTCKSGHQFSGNRAIVGLSRHEPTVVYSGYDDEVHNENWRSWWAGEDLSSPTNEDLVELADYMISLWQDFRRYYQENANGGSCASR